MRITSFEVGEVEYRIKEAIDYKSQAGNQSIRLKVELKDRHSALETVYCYLTPKMGKLIGSFCAANSLNKQWQDKNLDPIDCENKSGRCITYMESSKDYGDQVRIKEFCLPPVTDGHGMPSPPPANNNTKLVSGMPPEIPKATFDDDIPF